MKTHRITSNGQITIPVKIRQVLNLERNTNICFIKNENQITIQPLNKKYFNSLICIANTKGKTLKSLLKEKQNEKI